MSQNPQSMRPDESSRSKQQSMTSEMERSDTARTGAGVRSTHTPEAVDHAVERASEVSKRVRSKVTEAADDGKARVAEEIRAFGHAADAAAKSLQENEHPQVSRYVRGMCEQCEHVADYLDRKDPSDLLEDASRVARSNPALFLGAAALTGFAIGRFISATTPRNEGMRGHVHEKEPSSPERTPASSMYSEGGV